MLDSFFLGLYGMYFPNNARGKGKQTEGIAP